MGLAEGGTIIAEGINVTKTTIPALDNLSIWQLLVAFLVFDVIAWAIIKIIRGRTMSESAVAIEETQEYDDVIDEQYHSSFAGMDNDDTWSND